MQYRYTCLIVFWALVILIPNTCVAQPKVIYVDSYHQGYPWSDGIYRAISNEFSGMDIGLTVIHLDSKRHPGKPFIRDAASRAYDTILSITPDIIIASDDNASRYLVMPHLKNSTYPVIFCGVNWDAGIYGYPFSNTTGMIEISDIKRLIGYLENFTGKKKIAYLAANVLTARKEGHYYTIALNRYIQNVLSHAFWNGWNRINDFRTNTIW